MAAPLSSLPPVTDDEFARYLAALGPFETHPTLAVAVSGGADSLALVLLADRWARPRGGRVIAITVDHGLRAESAAEAAEVGRRLTARGIFHRIVAWSGAKPTAGVQAAAREARLDLLVRACEEQHVLHLLLAHQADDQAETFVMRLAAESGPDGLAGMAPVVELAGVRLLRPLLGVPRARLEATLSAAAQPWIDDPSNRDPRFARARLRPLAGGPEAALAAARGYAVMRVARDGDTASLLARAGAIRPGGWAELDPGALADAPPDIARRAILRTILTIGGGEYPPRAERMDRLVAALCEGRLAGGRTLGGCRVAPRQGRLVVVREAAGAGPAVPIDGPGTYVWDARFVVQVAGKPAPQTRLGALGADGWAALVSADKSLKRHPIPALARVMLPALQDLDGVVDVPHLSYRRRTGDPDSVGIVSAVFRPRHVLAGAGFALQ